VAKVHPAGLRFKQKFTPNWVQIEVKMLPIRRHLLMGSKRRPQPLRLAGKLLTIRQSLRLTQQQMANRLDSDRSPVYPTHISEFERGLREPSLLVLLKYAQIAKVSVETLIDDDLNMPSGLKTAR
jgi:DNA-binding XRE family transcriptional regulator